MNLAEQIADKLQNWFGKETAHQRALRKLREALCFLYGPSMNDIREADLLKWMDLYPPGTGTKSQPVNYVHSYVEVKPADEPARPADQEITDLLPDVIEALLKRYPLSEEELFKIYKRCGNNVVKLINALKLMEFTYKTDQEVLEEYDYLMQQYGNKLK